MPGNLHDITLAKNWISKCLKSHEGQCGHDNSSDFPLKVINCISRDLCEIAPGTPYVCLSYVWGNAAVVRNVSSNLSERLPKTIEDSIWVTLQLGYSYLWIDRYCIDQQDEAEKHHLITNMGEIYRGATLTIIAAAGDNPQSGLPGVNGTRRQQFSHAEGTLGQTINSLEDPHTEILVSVWNTRGWTYQELVLSRRRLVFTESQIYFQCKSMHRIGSLSLQDVNAYNDHRSGMLFQDNFIAFRNLEANSTVQTLYEQIEEYYVRRLSFREDTIKAVTGIINAFRSRQSEDSVRVTHLFGIPVFYDQMSPTFCFPSEMYHDPVFTPTSTFLYGLSWSLAIETGEKDDTVTDTLFPSWSWASMKAYLKPIESGSLDWADLLITFSHEKDSQVWLHDQSGISLELDHYIRACGQEDKRSLLPMISIRSWVVSCNIKPNENGDIYSISGFRERSDGFLPYLPHIPTINDAAVMYLGHILPHPSTYEKDSEEFPSWCPVLLVVEKVNDLTWRQIGRVAYYGDDILQDEDSLTRLNRLRPEGGWEMRTLCLV
ncbi:unnamed protein product [Alternaria alternata]